MVRDTGPDGPGRTDHGRSQKLSGTGIFRRNLRAPLRKKEEIPWIIGILSTDLDLGVTIKAYDGVKQKENTVAR